MRVCRNISVCPSAPIIPIATSKSRLIIAALGLPLTAERHVHRARVIPRHLNTKPVSALRCNRLLDLFRFGFLDKVLNVVFENFIDDFSELSEAESLIPLQYPGHVIKLIFELV